MSVPLLAITATNSLYGLTQSTEQKVQTDLKEEPLTVTAARGSTSIREDHHKLRIMHVVNCLGRGGAEFGILKLMEGLDAEEFEHRLCITRKFDPEFVRDYHLAPFLSDASGAGDGFQFPLFRLIRIFRRYKPHIVHTRNWGALEAVVAARLARIPVVIHSEHGYEIENMRGLPLRQRIFRRFAYGLADRVFTVTKELRDYHAAQAWTNPECISVLYNGVDTSRFYPCAETRERVRRELGLPSGCIVLGSVGRMVPIKDYGTLLEAAGFLRKKGADVRVLLVGKGPELDVLQAQARSVLPGRVTFTGASDRVPELLNAMDIFVLCSLGEGMSNTVLEAMSTGLPIIATRVGGNTEVIGGENSEWLFTPGHSQELTDRIERLISEGMSRLSVTASRARAITEFGLDPMRQRYRDLYTKAAEERGVRIEPKPIHQAPRPELV
jgi:sugar transferase (PEP-CTERM/EpsH1 system associated)